MFLEFVVSRTILGFGFLMVSFWVTQTMYWKMHKKENQIHLQFLFFPLAKSFKCLICSIIWNEGDLLRFHFSVYKGMSPLRWSWIWFCLPKVNGCVEQTPQSCSCKHGLIRVPRYHRKSSAHLIEQIAQQNRLASACTTQPAWCVPVSSRRFE